jgi:hypothetical protein
MVSLPNYRTPSRPVKSELFNLVQEEEEEEEHARLVISKHRGYPSGLKSEIGPAKRYPTSSRPRPVRYAILHCEKPNICT